VYVVRNIWEYRSARQNFASLAGALLVELALVLVIIDVPLRKW
jgi:hypothetical protein